jgi:hypothetical protein
MSVRVATPAATLPVRSSKMDMPFGTFTPAYAINFAGQHCADPQSTANRQTNHFQ